MLRRTFCALQVDAGRRLIWITPCKPLAQLGDMNSLPYPNCEAVQPATGLRREVRSAPSCARGLHGVIHFGRLPAFTCNAQIYTLRNISE
jgi:hypothetical protein